MKRHRPPNPDTRIGNCAACNRDPMLLYLSTIAFEGALYPRYRCSECFEKENGHRHWFDHERPPTSTTRP